MGSKLFPGNRQEMSTGRESERERFGAYFPRVFAYVHHSTGSDTAAREIVTTAFSRALARAGDAPDDEFRMAIFGTARDLCIEQAKPRLHEGVLGDRERDVLSLVFDAQLNRADVAALLGISEEAVAADLIKGLRKLRGRLPDSTVPSFLRLT